MMNFVVKLIHQLYLEGMGGLRVLSGDNGAEILSSGKIPPYSGFIPSGYFPSGFFPSGYFPSGYFPWAHLSTYKQENN